MLGGINIQGDLHGLRRFEMGKERYHRRIWSNICVPSAKSQAMQIGAGETGFLVVRHAGVTD